MAQLVVSSTPSLHVALASAHAAYASNSPSQPRSSAVPSLRSLVSMQSCASLPHFASQTAEIFFPHLTFILQVDRRDFSSPSPSATIAVRIFGSRAQGWAIGASATYKAEGFAHIVGEMEGALLFSFARHGLRADLNGVFGAAFAEREMDAEVKSRFGYDVTSWMRIGADSRFRMRVGGGKYLAGGRSYDAVGGPEIVFGYEHFFASILGGPSTVGVARGFGWTGTTTIGAALF